jgi:hypothetical protein
MSDVVAFIWAVGSHWVASMSGVVAIAAGVVQHFRRAKLPPLLWITVGTVCLFIASYQAWLDEHKAYEAAQCKIQTSQKRSEAKKQLADFFNQADRFIFANLTKASSENDVSAWTTDANKWIADVSQWAQENLGPQAVAKLNDITSQYPSVNLDRAINTNHNDSINKLIKIKQNIGNLM